MTVLTWLLVIFGHLDGLSQLHPLYAIFFHYLEYETLRPLLCELLYRLTRRVDILPHRIQRLLQLFSRTGCQELPLYGVLVLYKQFCPSDVIIPPTRQPMRAPYFKPVDPAWTAAVQAVNSRPESRGHLLVGAAPPSL